MGKHIFLTSQKSADEGVAGSGAGGEEVGAGARGTMVSRVWARVRAAGARGLALHGVPARTFATCQWQRAPTSRAYLLYRWAFLVVVVGIMAVSFLGQELRFKPGHERPELQLNYFKWLIYLTNWGLMLIAAQALLALILLYRTANTHSFSDVSYLEEASGGEWEGPDCGGAVGKRTRTPLLCRAYWLLHYAATDYALVITLVYWTVVHDPEIHPLNASNVLVHACNSALMLVELALTSHPYRLAHVLYTVALGLGYAAFTLLYWALGGTSRTGDSAIYPSLDWTHPGKAAMFVCGCTLVTVSAHALAALAAGVRARLAARVRWRRRNAALLRAGRAGGGPGGGALAHYKLATY